MSGCGDDDPDDEGREAAGSNTESVSRRAERRKKENKGGNNFQQRKMETALVFSKILILASSATEGIHKITGQFHCPRSRSNRSPPIMSSIDSKVPMAETPRLFLPHLPPPAAAGIRDIAEFVPRVNLLLRHTSHREKFAPSRFEDLRKVGH
jgi:hypothetical protein